MPYYESNEPLQRVDGVGNGAMAGAVLGGVASSAGVFAASKYHGNMDARMDAKADSLEKKRSGLYENASKKEAGVDEKVNNMRKNPIEAARTVAGKTAQKTASSYYKPAYNMERGSGGGNVVMSAEEAMQDRVRKGVAGERYAHALEESSMNQWGGKQQDMAHNSFVNRQGNKRQKMTSGAKKDRQTAHEMQSDINHLKDANWRSQQKANSFYGKRLGGWKGKTAAIGGSIAAGAISGAFLDAAATDLNG